MLASALILNGTIANSQQAELDPITVTASLHPVSANTTGRNITVISGESISKFPVNSIDELLRYLPGLEVQARGPMGAQSDIVLRGGTFQQVLVVLDGIRLNDPNTGHFNSYIPIAPSEIERIEVLKGASSAIYGTEAVGGVIHIITKTFASKGKADGKQISAQGVVGEYGLWNAQVGGYLKKGKTAVAAGAISNNATGQLQRGTRGFFYNNTLSGSVSHSFSENLQLSFRSAYDSRDFAAQNFYTTFASDTAKEKVTSLWNHLKLAYQKGKHQLSFDVGHKHVKDEFTFNSASLPNLNKSQLLQALAVHSYQFKEDLSITSGAQWVNKQISSNDRGNHQLDQVGAFVLLNKSFNENLFINPAIRVDYHERAGWEVIPQVNVAYKLPHWQLRASAGKTTRDADFTERFNNYNRARVTSGSIGNPDLTAERSTSYEAGVDYLGIKNLRISSTFFQRFNTDLVDWVPTPFEQMPRTSNLVPTGRYALAKNIAKVTSTGFETDVKYVHQLSKKQQLFAMLGLVWINSESSDAVPSFYISSHARFLTNFNVEYRFNRFSVSVAGLYKQRGIMQASAINATLSKEYFVLNTKLQAMLVNGLNAFVQVDNLLDENYSDLLGSQMPGRWLMGGLRFNFNQK